jgi:hypothetical protein
MTRLSWARRARRKPFGGLRFRSARLSPRKPPGKLGHELGWRVTWLKVNQAMTQESANRKSRKKEEMGRLQDVERAARALDALLDEDHPAISRLMR